tara:strand:+ start:19758 stop:20189 length:432 start_codon:yes stop_codon:yes gene_type:complete
MVISSQTVHATCVALAGQGILITGPSGSGKSGLALQLMAMGAMLVADDRTVLTVRDGILIASAPQAIEGLIEARGVGILTVPFLSEVAVGLCVEMSLAETERMPQRKTVTLLDISLPSLHKIDAPYFAAAIHAYITGNTSETS